MIKYIFLLYLLVHFCSVNADSCSPSPCGTSSCCAAASGPVCFDPKQYSCFSGALCPSGTLACGAACYSPSDYNCSNGQLVQATHATTASSTQGSSTSSHLSSSTKASSTKASSTTHASSSTTKATSTKASSSTKATSATSTKATSSSSTTGSATGVCATNSPCGAQSCCDTAVGAQCYVAGQYSCFPGQALCLPNYYACGSACYLPSQYSCQNGQLAPPTPATSISASGSTTASSSSSKTTSSSSTSGSSTTGGSSGKKIYGLDYTARESETSCPSQAQVNEDISIIDSVAGYVRIYSLVDCNQGFMIMQAIKDLKLNLRVALGIWLDVYYSAEFANEYPALVNIAQTFRMQNVDYIIVGSETQYRGDFSSDILISYIQNVSYTIKTQLGFPDIKVSTADVIGNLLVEPDLIAAVDVVVYNEFPFWEGVSINGALADAQAKYQQMKNNAQGKPIIFSETGWPDQGPSNGAAVPSVASENTYFQQIVCWANSNGIMYFYFEAFDALWQTMDDQRHWGIYDNSRQLKAGISLDFSC